MNDEQFERRMRDWKRAELDAAEAERAARQSPDRSHPEGVESPWQRAARLRRLADAILASIRDDLGSRVHRTAESEAS